MNVAALPAEFLESELFGHAKGAFTGAGAPKRGMLESADGGTLLLDEIAEMPLALQAKLLRALQDGEIRRVGETHAFLVDVRIVCATHEDLRAGIAVRRFREDLYYRLRSPHADVPPLRERREDVLPLARTFPDKEVTTGARPSREERPRNPPVARQRARARKGGEARRRARRGADVDCRGSPEDVVSPSPAARPFDDRCTLADVEREHVARVLDACEGPQIDAARVLGIARTTLWRKLSTLGLVADE